VPATDPAVKSDGSLHYEVIAVKGGVRMGPSDLDPKFQDGWSFVKVGDTLTAGLQVHVPFRGAVKLVARPAEPPTVIKIERCSRVNISELFLKDGVAKSRIELAYGAVTAGVAEGRTRSDIEIRAPVATLSKRGTDIFRFEYYNGRFHMSLSEQGRGRIQAIQMRSTAFGGLARMRSRFVTPGQWVTHQMARAIDNTQFDRQININDMFGLSELDQLFTLLNDHGIGFLLPQGRNLLGSLDSPNPDGQVGTTPAFDPDTGLPDDSRTQPLFRPLRHQNAGDFGIGQGRVPSVFGSAGKPIRTNVFRDLTRAKRKQALLGRQGRKR
jgi:hypothetical protein